MINKLLNYDPITGKINYHLEGADPTIQEGHYVEYTGNFDYKSNYIDVNSLQVIERPLISVTLIKPSISANGVEVSVISGIPSGALLSSDEDTITADGNPIEFVTDIPGEHRLQITLWPYQDAEVIINAI